ncbi:MAG: hypothetical protein U0793_17715 [Gemmataceae bacterium]
MATDPRKRQKKLAKKVAKRKEKHHLLIREKCLGLAERLAAASRHPILHAGIASTLWNQGIGQAYLSRELPNGSIAFATFLIDRYCLGVKNAHADIVGRFSYESDFLPRVKDAETAAPAKVRKLVEDAVEYARKLGFAPHPDYHKAKAIFGDIDPAACDETFEFGKDGKPLFINGPYDTPDRCRQIISTLERSRGRDGYHFVVGGPATSAALSEEDDEVVWEKDESL